MVIELSSILFIVSTFLLAIIWSIVAKQLCITSITDKETFRRSSFAFLFCTITIILNIIYFLSIISPNYQLVPHFKVIDLENIFEIIGALVGAHIYRIFLTFLYDKLYRPMEEQNIYQPFIIKCTPMLVQIIITSATAACYTLDYLLKQPAFLQAFFVVVNVLILAILLIFVYIWRKVLAFSVLINRKDSSISRNVDILLAYVKGVLGLVIVLGIIDIIVIFVAFDFILHFTPWDNIYNEELLDIICESMFLIMTNIPLILWAYDRDRSECCAIDEDSVCSCCGCGCCCKKRKHQNQVPLIQSRQSTRQKPFRKPTGTAITRTVSGNGTIQGSVNTVTGNSEQKKMKKDLDLLYEDVATS